MVIGGSGANELTRFAMLAVTLMKLDLSEGLERTAAIFRGRCWWQWGHRFAVILLLG